MFWKFIFNPIHFPNPFRLLWRHIRLFGFLYSFYLWPPSRLFTILLYPTRPSLTTFSFRPSLNWHLDLISFFTKKEISQQTSHLQNAGISASVGGLVATLCCCWRWFLLFFLLHVLPSLDFGGRDCGPNRIKNKQTDIPSQQNRHQAQSNIDGECRFRLIVLLLSQSFLDITSWCFAPLPSMTEFGLNWDTINAVIIWRLQGLVWSVERTERVATQKKKTVGHQQQQKQQQQQTAKESMKKIKLI